MMPIQIMEGTRGRVRGRLLTDNAREWLNAIAAGLALVIFIAGLFEALPAIFSN